MIDSAYLLKFLDEEIGVDITDINDETPLFSSGLVDSFALVTLMMHLEDLGGFRIDPNDVTLENLDTIGAMVGFVDRARVQE